jgi:uncharacterized radical SAM superfamily Fe-S cluster-containing enzyme
MALGVRDYLIEEYTKSVCPECIAAGARDSTDPKTFKDAMLVTRGGSVWMRRYCAIHGWTESLYEEDADLWRARHGWSTPTKDVVADRAGNDRPFPDGYRNGLPTGHGQHTCILLLNVTEHCNYRCPTCYATALEPGTKIEQPERPTLDELLRTVDTMVEREGGRLGVLMLSGGEPTVRRDIERVIEECARRPVTRVMLNTNGRRIAKDEAFVRLLEGLNDRVEVYLQFDGLTSATSLALRGEDTVVEKRAALDRLAEAGVMTTLVTTVSKGVNEHELGALARFGLEHPAVSGWAIQPVFGSGRNPGLDPTDRVTPTGVVRRLEQQTEGLLPGSTFVPLPCSHRDCCDIGYMVRDKRDAWRPLTSLVGREELKRWIHLAANTISFETASGAVKEMVRDGVLQRLFSEQQKTSSLALARDVFRLCGCVPGLTEAIGAIASRRGAKEEALKELTRRTFRITVKMFMDAHTFHEARIRQCCVHTGTYEDDPRRYSFCWRWLFSDATDFPARELEPLRMAK